MTVKAKAAGSKRVPRRRKLGDLRIRPKVTRSKRAPGQRELEKDQIRLLGILYDEWAKDLNSRIILPAELEKWADSLVDLGQIVRFAKKPYRTIYRIKNAGRLRYEGLEPKKAAESRGLWRAGDSNERMMEMLGELGYTTEIRNDHTFTIKQAGGEESHLLSPQEASDLITCPFKHPLALSEYKQNGASGMMAWYSFPQDIQ